MEKPVIYQVLPRLFGNTNPTNKPWGTAGESVVELGEYGIRVNCVAPGGILIERTEKEAPDYAVTWSAVTPLGRVGYARDIADAVLFLADA